MDDEEIEALQKQLFDLRVKQATKQDLKTSDFKKLRKDIARRKTAQTSGDWSAVEAASDSAASGDSVAMFAVAGHKGMPCSRRIVFFFQLILSQEALCTPWVNREAVTSCSVGRHRGVFGAPRIRHCEWNCSHRFW